MEVIDRHVVNWVCYVFQYQEDRLRVEVINRFKVVYQKGGLFGYVSYLIEVVKPERLSVLDLVHISFRIKFKLLNI